MYRILFISRKVLHVQKANFGVLPIALKLDKFLRTREWENRVYSFKVTAIIHLSKFCSDGVYLYHDYNN